MEKGESFCQQAFGLVHPQPGKIIDEILADFFLEDPAQRFGIHREAVGGMGHGEIGIGVMPFPAQLQITRVRFLPPDSSRSAAGTSY